MIDVHARTRSGVWSGLRILLCGLSVALTVLFASSCGNEILIVGTPVITLTAKPGRFTSYIVAIDEIEMTRKDGSIVELPTVSERVDLAHLSSYANLLEAPALGIGTYVSATFFLDYSSAYITVGNDGQAFPVKLLDASTGTTPTTATVTVKFDPNNPLVITSQTSSVVAFDIDLEASNSIVYNSSTGFQVTVEPFWNVTTQPAYDKPVYARGLFVYSKDSYFVMNVRPLHDVFDNPFGALTVNVTDQTYYNVSGVAYVGAPGLAALQALQTTFANLQVAAYGPSTGNPFADLSTITPSFNATAVYAGTSLENLSEDEITGIVAGVSGNTLNIMDAALVTREGVYGFQQSTPVTLGPNTIISEDGVASFTPSMSAISIGQVVTVSGLATLDASGNPTSLDATGDSTPGAQLRLQNTTMFGTVNSSSSGSLSLNMLSLDYYQPTYLDFTGTGVDSASDATAANYTVNTSAVAASPPAPGSLVKINGFANTFGAGPPYFNATDVTPASSLESQLIIEWSGSGSLTPFTVVNQTAIIVDLDDAALPDGVHIVRTGPTSVDLMNQANPHLLVINYATPTATSPVLFGVGNVVIGESLFTDPQSFANQVLIAANGALPVTKLVATGQYDPNAGVFTATHITVNVIKKQTT